MDKRVCGVEEMEALGAAWAAAMRPGLCVYFDGDLGTGKTTLIRGILRGLGYSGRVRSPTYTLIETYRLRGMDVYHIDLYRIADVDDLESIGLRDLLDGRSVCLVEWAQRGRDLLPPADVQVRLRHDDDARIVSWEGALIPADRGTERTS